MFASGWLAGLLPLMFLAACGGAPQPSSSPSSGTPVLESLQIIAVSASLPKGLTSQLSAVGHLSNGSLVDLSAVAVWTSTNTAVAAVGSGGSLYAASEGNATVYATVSSLSTHTGIAVTAPVLLSLDIQPPSQSLAKGLTTGFHAYGRYTDGVRRDVTDQAAWSAMDPQVVDMGGTAAGRATTLATGTTRIEASLAGVISNAQLTVTDAALVGLEVFPGSLDVAKGTEASLKATARYSDNTWSDVSADAAWQSSDNIVSTVNSMGRLSGVLPGTATVTASLGAFSGGAEVTVTNAVLTSLDIAPRNATLAAGNHLQLSASGGFSDGTRQDVSDAVLWGSSDASVADIGTGADGNKAVEARAPGSVQLTADLAGIRAATPLQVKARVLTAIHVTPSDPRLALGSTLDLGARGDFDDGSSQTLTDRVTWESQNSAVAMVGASGMVTPVAPGKVRITASRGDITGNVLLTVTSATLDTLDIVLDTSSLAAGFREQLTALGHYSDGSTQDLSGQVLWASSDRAVADIQTGPVAEVATQAPGTVTLTARFGDVVSERILTVTNAVLASLDIGPAAPSVDKGGVLALSGLGHYSDGSQQNVTRQVVWSSADPSIADVSNASGEQGRVSGVGSGNVAVTAALGGITASTTLTVLDDPQAPVALTVTATPNAILGDGADTSHLTVQVLAAGSGATVADGTVIDYRIMQGNGMLASGTAATTNGQASVNMQAVSAGLIVLEATVAGTSIGNDVAIYAVADFSEVLALAAPFTGTVTDGTVPEGSRFGLFVFNLSNREFSLDRFRFTYAGVVRIDSDDPVRLNQNRLPGGSHASAVVELANDFPLQVFSAGFQLSDPVSGQSFNVEQDYSISE